MGCQGKLLYVEIYQAIKKPAKKYVAETARNLQSNKADKYTRFFYAILMKVQITA